MVHDAQLLLAAAGLDDGIALIAGTGSVAWGITPDGRAHRAGGWGYLLGDEGSGYGVARAAVRHVLDRLDRAAAPDRLTAALVAGCGLTGPEHLLERFYANPERRYWAARRPAWCSSWPPPATRSRPGSSTRPPPRWPPWSAPWPGCSAAPARWSAPAG